MKLPPTLDLSDGEVRVRRWEITDVDAVAEACADPEIARWIPVPVPYTRGDAEDFVIRRSDHEWESGAAAQAAVVDAAGGGLLGAIGITLAAAQHGIGEIGYWIVPAARRRGVASRAVALLADWGFHGLELARIEAVIDPDNLASQRTVARLGFVREGLLRSYRATRDGSRRDMLMYALLPDER